MPTAPRILQPENVINGSFGTLYDENGDAIVECQRIEAVIRINRRDLNRSGTRQMGYKSMTVGGEGTIGTVKTTSKWQEIVSEMMRFERAPQKIFKLTIDLNDPEALAREYYDLLKVRLWEATLGFNVNDVMEENIPFTFEGYYPQSHIVGDPAVSNYTERYQEFQKSVPPVPSWPPTTST